MIILKNTPKKFYCKRVKSLKAPRDVSSTCSISLSPAKADWFYQNISDVSNLESALAPVSEFIQ